jgi:D-alanyl-D-alanine carboxypeptidase
VLRLAAAMLMLLSSMPAAADDDAAPPPPPVRVLGHLAYGETERAALAPVPSLGGCLVRREAAEDLERMVSAARAQGIDLHAVSCFRSIEHQRRIFCRGARDCDGQAALRARFVGPPGHSEHATGYAVDFTQRGTGCPATEQCFSQTPAGQWLKANAASYGFELSFPAGNKQGVAWEPWHWRWVGRAGDARAEVKLARSRFQTAHADFPALPAVPRDRSSAPDVKMAAGTSPAATPVWLPSGGDQAASLLAVSAIRRPW